MCKRIELLEVLFSDGHGGTRGVRAFIVGRVMPPKGATTVVFPWELKSCCTHRQEGKVDDIPERGRPFGDHSSSCK